MKIRSNLIINIYNFIKRNIIESVLSFTIIFYTNNKLNFYIINNNLKKNIIYNYIINGIL